MNLYQLMEDSEKKAEVRVATAERLIGRDKEESKKRTFSSLGYGLLAGLVVSFQVGLHAGFISTAAFLVVAYAVAATRNEYIKKILKNDLRHEREKHRTIKFVLEKLDSEGGNT